MRYWFRPKSSDRGIEETLNSNIVQQSSGGGRLMGGHTLKEGEKSQKWSEAD